MINWLTNAIQIAALVAAAWYFIETLRKRPVVGSHLIALGVLEVVLVGQVVVSIVMLTSQDASQNLALFIGYLATTALILPVAGIWGTIDRSHWGTAVLCGACLAVAVLALRLDQLWRLVIA